MSAAVPKPMDEISRIGEHLSAPLGPLSTFGVTDRGSVRDKNEDNFLIAELTKALRVRQSSLPQPRTQYSEERGYLLLVADGMGGHSAGERASALAVMSIEDFVLNTLKWFFHLQSPESQNVLSEFQSALRQADARIFQEAEGHPQLQGMGTTLTMAYCLGRQLFVVHVGDSRCYLQRQGRLYQVTQDHTLVAELLRQGQINQEQAAHHRLRNVITNAVGGTDPGLRVEAHKVALEERDVLLLCTDGLTGMVPDERIGAVLQEEKDPERACRRLLEMALQAGGKDNVTLIVTRFDSLGGRP